MTSHSSSHGWPHSSLPLFHWKGMSSPDPKMRKAGSAVLGVITEGCSDKLRELLPSILPPLLSLLQDPEYYVRECACFALGALSPRSVTPLSSHRSCRPVLGIPPAGHSALQPEHLAGDIPDPGRPASISSRHLLLRARVLLVRGTNLSHLSTPPFYFYFDLATQ